MPALQRPWEAAEVRAVWAAAPGARAAVRAALVARAAVRAALAVWAAALAVWAAAQAAQEAAQAAPEAAQAAQAAQEARAEWAEWAAQAAWQQQNMAFGPPIEQEPDLTYFVYDEANRCADSMAMLAEPPAAGTNTAHISHAGLACPIFDQLAWGEAAIFKPDGAGGTIFIARVLASQWLTVP